MKRLLLSTALVALPLVAAQADAIYTINTGNTAGITGPFATVDVHLNSSTSATLTYSRLSTFVFGEMGAAVNASHFTVGPVSFTLAATSNKTPTFTATFNGGLDGFGNFALDETSNPNGFSAAVTSATFTLTDTSGTWANAGAVLTTNAGGGNGSGEAAIHAFTGTGNSFFAVGGPCTGTDCGGSPPPPPPPPPGVPEPASLALLGVGLLGLGCIRRRRSH